MFHIVNGAELSGTIKNSNEDFFYAPPKRKTEVEYKELIEKSQDYFKGIIDGSISKNEKYFIAYRVDAHFIFVEHRVQVKKSPTGYVFAGYDGNHRYAVAQKYKLNLLVDVIDE